MHTPSPRSGIPPRPAAGDPEDLRDLIGRSPTRWTADEGWSQPEAEPWVPRQPDPPFALPHRILAAAIGSALALLFVLAVWR